MPIAGPTSSTSYDRCANSLFEPERIFSDFRNRRLPESEIGIPTFRGVLGETVKAREESR
jgi:hypothetical protein